MYVEERKIFVCVTFTCKLERYFELKLEPEISQSEQKIIVDKCSDRSIKVQLSRTVIMTHQPTDQPIKRQTDQGTWGVVGKLHFPMNIKLRYI